MTTLNIKLINPFFTAIKHEWDVVVEGLTQEITNEETQEVIVVPREYRSHMVFPAGINDTELQEYAEQYLIERNIEPDFTLSIDRPGGVA